MDRAHATGNRVFYVDDDIVTFPSFHVYILRKSCGRIGEGNGFDRVGIITRDSWRICTCGRRFRVASHHTTTPAGTSTATPATAACGSRWLRSR
jgi:hypothetical protein